MEFSRAEIRPFRYWIQGYPKFYEPIVRECLTAIGYRVLRQPARIGKPDMERTRAALFHRRRRVGPGVDADKILQHLAGRQFLQPDALIERGGLYYLAEFKSWGGYTTSGKFDLALLEKEFVCKPEASAFFLIDEVDGRSIAGKVLVVSSRGPQHDRVLARLNQVYQTPIELLYLDELFSIPQIAGFIDRQLRYLDAAVAEIRLAFGR